MRIFVSMFCLFMVVFLSNCATIVSGKKQAIHFTSDPVGAEVFVNDRSLGKTPITIDFTRSVKDYTVRISLQGYEDYEVDLKRTFNEWFLGNIILGGVIGMVVDAASGAIYRFTPSKIHTEMMQEGGKDQAHLMTTIRVEMVSNVTEIQPGYTLVGRMKRR